jgi:acyl-CoA thioesterase
MGNENRKTMDTGPHHFTMEKWLSCAPFEQLLGINIILAEAGRAELTMPFRRQLAQGAGLMHGGALLSLADTAVVMAIKSLVAPATHFATISCESRFLWPVIEGIVTARASVRFAENGVLEGKTVIVDRLQREVMVFTATFKIARDSLIRTVSSD